MDIVDRRLDVGEGDRVVNERDETAATATNAITPYNRVARKRRLPRVRGKLCLLDASNKDAVAGEKVL